MLADGRESCGCPRKECPRHGKCGECIEKHKTKKYEPYCIRKSKKQRREPK